MLFKQSFEVVDMFGKRYMIFSENVSFVADGGDFTKICVDGYIIKVKEPFEDIKNKVIKG